MGLIPRGKGTHRVGEFLCSGNRQRSLGSAKKTQHRPRNRALGMGIERNCRLADVAHVIKFGSQDRQARIARFKQRNAKRFGVAWEDQRASFAIGCENLGMRQYAQILDPQSPRAQFRHAFGKVPITLGMQRHC